MSNLYKFYLKMHIGAPSVPCVKEGEFVERGQVIAEPNGLGARIHSSVSGKVFKITDKEILVEASENQSEDFVKIKERDSILDTVYEAGIVGAGGAGFPTHVKLKANIPEGYIIANCAECEPTLHHNVYLAENNPELIIKGIKYAMKATNAKKAYIGIKGKRKKAIEVLNEHLKNEQNIQIKEVIDIYPSGEERALIHFIFGEWLAPTQIPIEANCVVLNVETLANITRAVEDRKPVIDKDITLMGKLKKGIGPHVFLQEPIGKSMKDMIETCGGIDGQYGEIIIGGPHTGLPEDIEKSVITKVSGGATVTMELPEYKGPVGLLVCACAGDEDRLKDIASKMKSEVVAITKCKNVVEVRGTYKCKTPGKCPGQAGAVMYLKSKGAKRIIIANCSDCSNTVMGIAPKMKLPVYHQTDHVLRTVDYKLTRRLPKEKLHK
ncbi:proline reductase-associated electron transfer protein PrdC [Clostridium botulinum]|uniref:Proline reductase-associated electron transfer protein PrdC n=1 Tax=Clostridium botulinum TaxID=1491 RepID=A0ABD7CHX5_CLOBO|nr:proline reductase-associated electron transfer protein PrdC [Clostridium botulinum]KGO13503.1 electron transporter RnfC [Clostridium botulinum]KIN82480.1 electron transporter RnfC [Clostridium botulinum]MCC5427912.1 proline reductase-associated electron transfer protein PrdC [Clostridium botulinum]QRI52409.1 proline reductase-associated electron transfer protein PrdC [Clostridium botulinum]